MAVIGATKQLVRCASYPRGGHLFLNDITNHYEDTPALMSSLEKISRKSFFAFYKVLNWTVNLNGI